MYEGVRCVRRCTIAYQGRLPGGGVYDRTPGGAHQEGRTPGAPTGAPGRRTRRAHQEGEGGRSYTRAPTRGAYRAHTRRRTRRAPTRGAYQGRLPGAPTGAPTGPPPPGGVVGFSTGGGRKLNRMILMGHFFRIKGEGAFKETKVDDRLPGGASSSRGPLQEGEGDRVVGFSTGGGRKLNRMHLMGHFFRIKAG